MVNAEVGSATRWDRVLAVVFAGMAVAMQIGKVPAAVPDISRDLGLDLISIGWLLSLYAAVGAVLGAALGSLVDRIGYRSSLMLGLLLSALGSMAGGFAQDSGFLLSSRVVEAAGIVAVIVAAPAIVWRETNSLDQKVALGLWGCWMPFGTASIMIMSPVVMSQFGWRANWFVAAGFSVAALLFCIMVLNPDPRQSPAKARGGLLPVVKRLVSWTMALNFCFYSMSFMTVFGFLPKFLIDQQGFDRGLAAILAALGIIVNVVGNLSAGWLARRGVSLWKLIVISCICMGTAPWGIFSDTLPPTERYVLCLVFSIAGGLLPASLYAATVRHAPTNAHVATLGGFLVQGSSVGQLVGPPLLALMLQAIGSWSAAPIFLSITAGAGIMMALVFRAFDR